MLTTRSHLDPSKPFNDENFFFLKTLVNYWYRMLFKVPRTWKDHVSRSLVGDVIAPQWQSLQVRKRWQNYLINFSIHSQLTYLANQRYPQRHHKELQRTASLAIRYSAAIFILKPFSHSFSANCAGRQQHAHIFRSIWLVKLLETCICGERFSNFLSTTQDEWPTLQSSTPEFFGQQCWPRSLDWRCHQQSRHGHFHP